MLEFIKFVKDDSGNKGLDFFLEIQKQIENQHVVTRYNEKAYRICRVDFTKTPADSFCINDRQITYADYLHDRYKEDLLDLTQPLLLVQDRRNNQELYLVPEVCRMTGISDKMQDQLYVMKDIK